MSQITDHGHFIQITHCDCGGRLHRFTASEDARNEDTGEITLWKVFHESFLPFVSDHRSEGFERYGLSRSQAVDFLLNPNA